MYRTRWSVETDLGAVKTALGMAELTARTGAMVAKEPALGTVAYNPVVRVRSPAAAKAGVPPRRLSFAGAATLCRHLLLGPRSRPAAGWGAWRDRVLRACGQRRVPVRPGRTYPREILPRGRKYPTRRTGPDPDPGGG